MSKIKFELLKDFKDPRVQKFLEWWSSKTHHEHLLCRTSAFFRNNLICAFKASIGHQFIGAAGMIPSLNRKNKPMKFEGYPIVEFCSNFVEKDFRRKGVGETGILYRMEEADKNNYLPIIVTRHPRIIDIISGLGWEEMNRFRKYDEIRSEIRDCTCEKQDKSFIGERCEVCPLLGKSIWVKQIVSN